MDNDGRFALSIIYCPLAIDSCSGVGMKNGWQTNKLGDIADVKGGKRVPKGYKLQSKPTEHPYITVSDFTDHGTIDTSKLRYVNRDVFKEIQRYTISSNDLYLSIAGTIGKTGFVPPELDGASLTENACKLVLRPGIDRDFIYYFTKSDDFARQAGTNTRIAAQPKLALERLKTITVPVPDSFHEQRRIVGILDEAFAGIATAKANFEANLQNARALFESHLQSVFTQQGGQMKKLAEVCQIKPPKAEARRRLSQTDLVSFVPMEDLGTDEKTLAPTRTRPLGEVAGSYTYFADGDVLLAKITPCFENGKLGIATDLTNGIGFGSSEYIVFRPDKSINNEWLYYFLSRKQFRFEGAKRMGGAVGHKRVAKDFIELYPIPVPPLPEQQRIMGILDALRTQTQRLESIYRRKLAALDELKKSLLHQAFSGAL